MKIDKLCIFKP